MNEIFTVTGYTEDVDGLFHIFQSNCKVHICFNAPLIGEDDTEYYIEEALGSSTTNLHDTLVGLISDHGVRLPIGTVLTAGKEPWRLDIPDSEITSVAYESKNVSIWEFETNPFHVPYSLYAVIDIDNGSHLEIRSDYKDFKSREEMDSAKTDGIKELFAKLDKLLRDEHCYRWTPSDDTGRGLFVHYRTGETLHYDGVISNENNESADILRDFLTYRFGKREIYL